MTAKTSKTARGGQADRIRKKEKQRVRKRLAGAGEKSNLHPGGSEGRKSIYNGHMIRARKTASGGTRGEESGWREEEEERRSRGEEAAVAAEY